MKGGAAEGLVHGRGGQGRDGGGGRPRRTAAVPSGCCSRIRPLDAPVRGTTGHDLALSGSYGMVRLVNRVAGKTVDVTLDVLEGESTDGGLRHQRRPG